MLGRPFPPGRTSDAPASTPGVSKRRRSPGVSKRRQSPVFLSELPEGRGPPVLCRQNSGAVGSHVPVAFVCAAGRGGFGAPRVSFVTFESAPGESASRSSGNSLCSPTTPSSLLGRIDSTRMRPSLLPETSMSSVMATSESTARDKQGRAKAGRRRRSASQGGRVQKRYARGASSKARRKWTEFKSASPGGR